MELFRITTATNSLLERLFPLYEAAFPEAERRTRQQLTRMIAQTGAMNFNAILMSPEELAADSGEPVCTEAEELFQGQKVCGLFSFWNLGDFLYLEHLATFPELRNRRIGGKVLSYMEQHYPTLQLLEVEPPTDELTRRRVAYYERNGFCVLNRSYVQPPYSQFAADKQGLPLWIMGRGTAGNTEEKIETIQQKVYFEPYALENE